MHQINLTGREELGMDVWVGHFCCAAGVIKSFGAKLPKGFAQYFSCAEGRTIVVLISILLGLHDVNPMYYEFVALSFRVLPFSISKQLPTSRSSPGGAHDRWNSTSANDGRSGSLGKASEVDFELTQHIVTSYKSDRASDVPLPLSGLDPSMLLTFPRKTDSIYLRRRMAERTISSGSAHLDDEEWVDPTQTPSTPLELPPPAFTTSPIANTKSCSSSKSSKLKGVHTSNCSSQLQLLSRERKLDSSSSVSKFAVLGKVDAEFALSGVEASVNIAYNLSEIATTFPPQSGSADGSFNQGIVVRFFSSPHPRFPLSRRRVRERHGPPHPAIGNRPSVFGGIASSTIFLNFDASVDLSLFSNSTSAGYPQSYVDASTELAVNIGAEASFFGLPDTSTGETLFENKTLLLQKCIWVSGPTAVSLMLHELHRNYRALCDGDDTDASNSGQPYARGDSQLVFNDVTLEKATTHTTDIATLASSIVTSMTTALTFQVAHAAGSSGDPLSTSMPDEQHDIGGVLPHITADLDAVGSILSPTLTAASSMSENPHLDSIQDAL
ncbi:hypothetical protein V8E53_008323 [Lactarius tabidus]